MKSRRKKETQSLSVHKSRQKREGYQNLAMQNFQMKSRELYNFSDMTSSLKALLSFPGKNRNKTTLRTSNMLPLGMRDFYKHLESRTLVNDLNKSANGPVYNPLTVYQGPIYDSYNPKQNGLGEQQYPQKSLSNFNVRTQKCTIPTEEGQSMSLVKSLERPKTNCISYTNVNIPITNQMAQHQSEKEQNSDMRSYLASSDIGKRPMKQLFQKGGPQMFNNEIEANEYFHSSIKQTNSNLSHQKPSSYYSTFYQQKPLSHVIPQNQTPMVKSTLNDQAANEGHENTSQENLSYTLKISEKKRFQAAKELKQHKVKIDRIKKKMVNQNQYGSYFESNFSEANLNAKSRNQQQSESQQLHSNVEKPIFPQLPTSIFSSFSNVNITRAMESNFTFNDQRTQNLEGVSTSMEHGCNSSSPYRDTKQTQFTQSQQVLKSLYQSQQQAKLRLQVKQSLSHKFSVGSLDKQRNSIGLQKIYHREKVHKTAKFGAKSKIKWNYQLEKRKGSLEPKKSEYEEGSSSSEWHTKKLRKRSSVNESNTSAKEPESQQKSPTPRVHTQESINLTEAREKQINISISNYRYKINKDLPPQQKVSYSNIMKPIIEAQNVKPDPNIEIERQEQEHRLKLKEWQKKMWVQLEKNNKARVLASRPKYIDMYGSAKQNHIDVYLTHLKKDIKNEQEVKESLWRPEKEQTEYRPCIRYIFQQKEVSRDDFIEILTNTNSSHDLQTKFFEEVKELVFPFAAHSILEKMHDGEITTQNELKSESINEKRFVNELMSMREREMYYQRQLKEIFEERQGKETGIEYARACHKYKGLPTSNFVALPKGQMANKYIVINRTVFKAQAEALAKIFETADQNFIGLMLSNNSMEDSSFATILSQFPAHQLESLQSLVYRGKNYFSEESLQVLLKTYLRTKKTPLLELRLIDLNVIEHKFVKSLLEGVALSFIQKLTLAKMELEKYDAQILINILCDKTLQLKELDLSWNKFPRETMAKLMQALHGNNKLQVVRLAFNPISPEEPLVEFGNFIRHNNCLQHLDLSGVLQTSKQVKRIIKKCKKSVSLLSFHLSYTPCILIDFNLRNYIAMKLEAKDFSAQGSKELSMHQGEEKEQLKELNWREKYELITASKVQKREQLYFRQFWVRSESQGRITKKFIIQRTIAHNEIDGNFRWVINNECYLCDRWQYTLFFVPSKKATGISGTFKLLNHASSNDVKLVDVREFIRKLVLSGRSQEQAFQYIMSCMPMGLEDSSQEQLLARFSKDSTKFLTQNKLWHKVFQKAFAKQEFQQLPFKQDVFSLDQYTEQLSANQDPELFVCADYLKPSPKIERFFIKAGSEKLYHEFFVGEIRKKEIQAFNQDNFIKQNKEPQFQKEESVFKSWVKDNPNILKQALEFDLGYWKAAKFVRDTGDFNRCVAIIREYFPQLKHIFVNLISSDNYPHIGWNEFVTFCRSVDILDGSMPTSTVDRMFIATKVGAPKEGPGNTLFRHEFLEIMIRISNAKYRETKKVETYSEALSIMIKSIIEKYSTKPWQEFRDEELWSIKVDRLFKANINQLQKTYSFFFPKYDAQQGLKKCIDIFTRRTNLDITEKAIRFCFGMSKMTVKDEVANHDEYEKLKLTEYLEFIGRVAHVKFIDYEELELHRKIEMILDELFPVFSMKRKEVEEEQDDENTSEESLVRGDYEEIDQKQSLIEGDPIFGKNDTAIFQFSKQ